MNNNKQKEKLKREKKKECPDTFCITCGKKNCPKVDWCSRVDLEE